MFIIPPYLQEGDTIGLICPAGYMPYDQMQTCIETLKQWGFGVKFGITTQNQHNYFSGTDEQRLEDIQRMIDDKNVHAILCARGGYGITRIIDKINFSPLKKHPKWIIGYSDVTALHIHMHACKIATLHAPMAAAFNFINLEQKFIESLKAASMGKRMLYASPSHTLNRKGRAKARIIGGNLSLLVHLIGTPSDISYKNKILFIEDIGEYIYAADRMLMQLKRAGKLDKLAGLIVGGFTDMKDTVVPFGEDLLHLIKEKVEEFTYPVCFDFPVSHTQKNYALKCGVKHSLTVKENGVTLKETIHK